MPNSQNEIDLIAYCIERMSNKDVICPLLESRGFSVDKRAGFKKLAALYESNADALTVEDIRNVFRREWSPCDVDLHIDYLCSDLLSGHAWHKAMPSFLHRAFQDRVRDCFAGLLTFDKYLSLCQDIAKHEFFMVTIHDLCESAIIQAFSSVIPPIRKKCISDFVFGGIPYDLKITTHKDEWKQFAGRMDLEQKKQMAVELCKKADSGRARADADNCRNKWGLNRMFYVVNDQNKWRKDPRGTVQYLLDNLNDPGNFFDIEVKDVRINVCLIEQ